MERLSFGAESAFAARDERLEGAVDVSGAEATVLIVEGEGLEPFRR